MSPGEMRDESRQRGQMKKNILNTTNGTAIYAYIGVVLGVQCKHIWQSRPRHLYACTREAKLLILVSSVPVQ